MNIHRESNNLFLYSRECCVPAVPGQPMLELKEVGFRYPGASDPALSEVSLKISGGEKVALAGPNGAGKSTLIHLIAGLAKPDSGTVRILGNAAGECHHRVAYVPQRGEVAWNFPVSARQVVMMGRYVHLGWLRRPSPADESAVDAALAAMNIADIAGQQIGDLSGGQQQRVMLARALAQDADLLLLDEPLNSLDVPTQELIFDALDHHAELGKAVIMSTHDLGILPLHFTRAIFLDGKIVADGPVDEVIQPRTLLRAYGVHLHTHTGVWDEGEESELA
jgi:ABC-type Mn2+/Zn2+ transport system ATPase subunit